MRRFQLSVAAAAPGAGAREDPEGRLEALACSRGGLRRVLVALAAAWVERRGGDRLGWVRVGDHARERLGVSPRSVHDWARVERALTSLPRLEAALVSGALPWSKVRLLARFVSAEDEAAWIARARGLRVRELERRVRAVDRGALEAGGLPVDEDGGGTEPVESVRLRGGAPVAFGWQHTRLWAARVAGERVSPGTVLEMVTAEALSALPAGVLEFEPEGQQAAPPARQVATVCAEHAPAEPDVVAEDEVPAVAALPAFLRPVLEGIEAADAFELEARLRRVLRLEQRIDAEMAPLLRQVSASGYAWRGRRQTLGAFARDRLGMSPRKARALVRIERVGDVCPALRAAFREGSLSWVQAQVLAPLLASDAEGGWREVWCRFAGGVTVRRLEEVVECALLLREADPERWAQCRERPEAVLGPEEEAEGLGADAERQTCARPTDVLGPIALRILAPREVARLFRAVLCSLRRAEEERTGRLPTEGETFQAMLDHAMDAWGVAPHTRRAPLVFARDGWRCTVPGCTSQRNLHAHHVRFRSAGGGDEPENLTTLCAAHHQRGVHAGRVRITGRAPHDLTFELGLRNGRPPLVRYASGDCVVSAVA